MIPANQIPKCHVGDDITWRPPFLNQWTLSPLFKANSERKKFWKGMWFLMLSKMFGKVTPAFVSALLLNVCVKKALGIRWCNHSSKEAKSWVLTHAPPRNSRSLLVLFLHFRTQISIRLCYVMQLSGSYIIGNGCLAYWFSWLTYSEWPMRSNYTYWTKFLMSMTFSGSLGKTLVRDRKPASSFFTLNAVTNSGDCAVETNKSNPGNKFQVLDF